MATLGERGGIKCEDRVGQGVQDQRLGSPGGGLHPRCSVATPGEHKKFGKLINSQFNSIKRRVIMIINSPQPERN